MLSIIYAARHTDRAILKICKRCVLSVCIYIYIYIYIYHSYSEKPNKMQQSIKILLFLILNEAQHVLGDTPTHRPSSGA